MPRTENLGLQLVDGADYLRKAVMGKPNENMGKLDSAIRNIGSSLVGVAGAAYRPFALSVAKANDDGHFRVENGAASFGCTVGNSAADGADWVLYYRGQARNYRNVPIALAIAVADVVVPEHLEEVGIRLSLSGEVVDEARVGESGRVILCGLGAIKVGGGAFAVQTARNPGLSSFDNFDVDIIGPGGFRVTVIGLYDPEGLSGPQDGVTVDYRSQRGVSNMPGSEVSTAGIPYAVSDRVPIGDRGYAFAGWSPTDGATAAEYQPGDLIWPTEDVTLYAVWEPKTVTVTYSASGSGVSGQPAAQTGTAGQPITLTTDEPTRGGFYFVGWSVSSDGVTADFTAGETVTTFYDDVTLYAIWEPAS